MNEGIRRAVVAASAACLLTGAAAATAQQAPATGAGAGAAPAAGTAQPKIDPNQPVGFVNKEPITLGEVVSLLARNQIPPGSEERAYDSALDSLVNTHLLRQFLEQKAKISISAEELKKLEDDARATLARQNTSLETYLANTATLIEDFREQMAAEQKWRLYVTNRATDKELKDYVDRNRDLLNGVRVRASHILIKLDPEASPEAKEAARQKLLAIRQEIVDKKIGFPDAANKYSEDDGNIEQPSGGDLGKFPRRGIFIEPFSKAAFDLKKDELSDVVETEYGLHLIYITDRDEGQPIDFEQARSAILNQYAADLQTEIVDEMRKTAVIELKPMPKDLFQTTSTPAPAAAAGSGSPPAAR